jgi:His/Glu/Gln/Arg/opine family amino acid ABC transporter permease subunit
MEAYLQEKPVEELKPPVTSVGVIGWVRSNLFSSWFNSLLTIITVYCLWVIVPPLIRWAFIDSLWVSTGAECHQADGACWSIIPANIRFIMFGFYPYDQQWRPLVAMALLIGLLFYSRNRDHWKEPLAYAWIVGLFVMGLLMGSMTYFTLFLFLQVPILVLFIIVLIKQTRRGGVFNRIIGVVEIVGLILLIIVILFKPGGVLLGFIRIVIGIAGLGFLRTFIWGWIKHKELQLSKVMAIWTILHVISFILLPLEGYVFGLIPVETSQWGGLPLTLMLSVFGLTAAYPLGVVMALGRRSKMPAVKALCILNIELIRGVPLISLLFMSSVVFPLFLPEGVTINNIIRAQVAIILFTAAYIAEVVRGGLQAIPLGQYEAADSIGLSYYLTMRLVILPQALKIVIPPSVQQLISAFKDTSLVVIIALFDVLRTTQTALSDPKWMGFSTEAYIFVALIYFLCCFFMANYSRKLEKELSTEEH